MLALGATIKVTTRNNATHLETALWEFITFSIGVAVSLYLGQRSVKKAASDVIRPQARSALRRLVSLGQGIRVVQQVALSQAEDVGDVKSVSAGRVVGTINAINVLLEAQIGIVSDADEDWREFAPDLLNELEERAEHG